MRSSSRLSRHPFIREHDNGLAQWSRLVVTMTVNGHSDKLSDKLLAPLSAFYGNTDTVEIRICRPGQVIVETRGGGRKALGWW